MKKTFITVALFAVLGTLAVSCQKENMPEPMISETETAGTYLMAYSVDGVNMQTQLNDEEELRAFFRMLTALAREGHRVTVRNANAVNQSLTKERVEYHTQSEDDANKWAIEMTKAGYLVTIDYDEDAGEFICIAVK